MWDLNCRKGLPARRHDLSVEGPEPNLSSGINVTSYWIRCLLYGSNRRAMFAL